MQMDKDQLADASTLAERAKGAKKLEDEVALDYTRRADVIAAKRAVKHRSFFLLLVFLRAF